MYKYLALLIVFTFNAASDAAERLDILNVDPSKLTTECQIQMTGPNNEFGLAWWIPVEFWEVSLTSQSLLSNQGSTEMVLALRPYFIIAIVQADISVFGAFNFYPRDSVATSMQLSYIDSAGLATDLQILENSGRDIGLLVESMKPMLRASMGNLGQNFHFFILSDRNDNGERLADPYAKGELHVRLTSSHGNTLEASIESPLDALFIPRVCPNGKPAHVSWKYCPWTGQKLAD